jgi:hypothetical protein
MCHHVLNRLLIVGLLTAGEFVRAQDPGTKPPPDEMQYLIRLVERSHEDPARVDERILSDLRKQYTDQNSDREAGILRMVRRVYATTPLIEERIVREMHSAYKVQSAEQEERVLEAVRRGGVLPPGTVPPEVAAEQASRLFRRLDRDGNGKLSPDEMPESLKNQVATWDRNRDGLIDEAEYTSYFQASLKTVAAGVASGEIPVRQPRPPGVTPPQAGSVRSTSPSPPAQPRAPAVAAAKVPDWFLKLDEDGDGQVGLYEWKKAGRSVAEFLALDLNHDGFIEAKELLAYMAEHPEWKPGR